MKITAIEWQVSQSTARERAHRSPELLTRATRKVLLAIIALASAAAILTAATWLLTGYAHTGLGLALIWAAGFVFLALAVDSEGRSFAALLATGIALPLLALLGRNVAAEFAIIAAIVIAAWAAATIWKR